MSVVNDHGDVGEVGVDLGPRGRQAPAGSDNHLYQRCRYVW
jgi:hypothetical protein